MNKRDTIIFVSIILVTFFFLSLSTINFPSVLALINLNATLQANVNGTYIGNSSNHTYQASSSLVFFNVSFLNRTDITAPTNLTVLYSHTQEGPWLFFGNISLNTSQTAGTNNAFPHNLTTVEITGNSSYAWGYINISTAPENNTLHFNVTLSNGSTYYPLNGSNSLLYNVTIHNTPPQVSPANISLGHGKSGNGHNWSKTKITDAIDFNITIHWTVSNISTIVLNITNGSVGTMNMTWNYTYGGSASHASGSPNNLINASSIEASPTTFRNNATWNITSYPDGVYSIELTLINDSFNSAGQISTGGLANNTNRWYLFNITLDSVAPIVNTSNISNIAKGGNYSTGTNDTLINVSIQVDDFDSGINTVLFNISLGNGTQNGTLTGSKSGTYWNATIDTRNYKDGQYNITAIVNDSAGNVLAYNLLPVITNVSLDNTGPALSSFSCTPNSVEEGDTVTCSCSGIDKVTKVKHTTFTKSPSTSSTGTFTESCTIADFAGNEEIYTTTFSVEGVSSGSSGSGGGGGGSGGGSVPSIATGSTIAITQAQVSTTGGYRAQFSENSKAEIRVTPSSSTTSAKHVVTITKVKTNSVTIRVESEPINVDLSIGELKKVDIDEDSVYDLSLQLNDIVNNRADVSIKQIKEPAEVPVSDGEGISPGEDKGADAKGTLGEDKGSSKSIWIIIGIIILVAIVVAFMIVKRRGNIFGS